MAYQPIQMPGRPLMFEAMDQLGQTISRRRREAHQDDLDADAKKRQGQLDFQQALQVAAALKAKGDLKGAAAVMSPYQADLHEQPLPGMTPPLAGGSPLPDTMEFAGKRPGQPGTLEQNTSPGDFDTEHGQAPEQLPAAPPPSQPAPNPIMAARQAQQAGNQQRAHQVLSFNAPGGQKITWDPEAEQAQAREQQQQEGQRRLAAFDNAIATSNNPVMQKYGPELRAVIAMGNKEVDSTDILHYVQGRAKEEADAANKSEAARIAREEAAKEHELNRQAHHEDTGMMANAISGAAAARNNTAEGNAATSVASRFDSEFNRWQQQQGWGTVRTANRALQSAMTNAGSGNPLAEHDAQIQLARVFRGTTPTEGEMHLLYNNLAGKVGNAWPAFVEKMSRGGLSPAERDILVESIGVAKQEQQEQIGHIIDSARETFGPGSGHENMAGNVNAKVRGLFRGAGVQAPDVFEAQGGQALPTVTLGKGNSKIDPEAQHPAVGARADQKAKRAAALPNTKPAKLSDDDAVSMAQERLARNPNDAVAKRVLQMHGM
jgi:hypothetical protein